MNLRMRIGARRQLDVPSYGGRISGLVYSAFAKRSARCGFSTCSSPSRRCVSSRMEEFVGVAMNVPERIAHVAGLVIEVALLVSEAADRRTRRRARIQQAAVAGDRDGRETVAQGRLRGYRAGCTCAAASEMLEG